MDLGSNSFHLWVVSKANGSIRTIDKVKNKIKLASGINAQSSLSESSMQRGLDCLKLFKERLRNVKKRNIKVVATAAIRKASNKDIFLKKAENILGYKIEVISGIEEAKFIYRGAISETSGPPRKCVLDIGGASTEIIIGDQDTILSANSYDMGCVSFFEQFFPKRCLNSHNFNSAIMAAKKKLKDHIIPHYPWDICVGSSGTIKIIFNIIQFQSSSDVISIKGLYALKKELIASQYIEDIDIKGLNLEQALILPSGLSILIGIFEFFNIKSMHLSGGALREGLLNSLIESPTSSLYIQSLCRIQNQYQLENNSASILNFFKNFQRSNFFKNQKEKDKIKKIITACSYLYEIGLTIGFNHQYKHAAYLIQNINIPGFSPLEKRYISDILLRLGSNVDSLMFNWIFSQKLSLSIIMMFRLSIALNKINKSIYSINISDDLHVIITFNEDIKDKYPLTILRLESAIKMNKKIGFKIKYSMINSKH